MSTKKSPPGGPLQLAEPPPAWVVSRDPANTGPGELVDVLTPGAQMSAALKDTLASNLGHRLREARGTLSRALMAERLEVHENTVAKMERGQTVPDVIQLQVISAVTGRDVLWLLGVERPGLAGGSRKRSTVALEIGDQLFVPLFSLVVSAGHGAFNDEEQVSDMRAFTIDYVRNDLRISHEELALVNVVGNSMEPHIHSGDVVLIDRRDKDISVEGPHLVRVDGALLVKNVQRRPGGVLRVSSKNDDYAPFDINVMSEQLHDFEVLGRVRWAGVTFR